IGLIGYANGATIKNVVVNSSYIRGYQYVGGICGYAAGSTIISNCGYVGNVYGSYSYYGLAYISTATVENCYCVSNQPMASSATTNCYHDNTKYTGLTYCSIGKSSEAFERGEIAWLLNGGSSDGVWGQNIGTESIPFIGGKKVYVTALCPHSFAGSNVEGSFTPIEDGDEHYDSDGYCKVCGVGLAPELVGNYYEIAKVAHLYWFAEQVNSGNTSIRAKLIADIVVNKNVLKPGSLTLNGTPARKWVPIGMNFNTRYTGEFDGNGHTISGLYYDDTSYKDDNAHVGLIGYAERVWITNLIVKDSYLRGRKYVGGICGYADRCVMSRCGFEGYLYKSGSDGYNSGIAYDYNCRLENCFSRSNAPMGYNPYDSQLIFGCYHDKTLFAGTSTLSTGKTSEEFASGEVAYSIRIGQNIGIDESPNFGGAEVFKLSATVASGAHGTFSCASYANAGATAFTAEPEIGYELVLQIGGGTIAYTGNTFNMPAQNTTLSVDFVKANYAIAKEANYVGGKVTVKATAQYQDEVSISVVPDPGYVIETYELTDASGNAIAVTNGKFTMPASAVSISASFSPTGYVENGQVYGDWVVTSDYTIAEGETLVIPAGTTVTTYGGAVIINNG
ncbi:MAG: hypothetical protein MJZ27_11995, partial [Bacteroidales bacterium]|nr:hypothetical protein [Bacteroidales bacterium]